MLYCERHAPNLAIADCDDCGRGLCPTCLVIVDRIGGFCKDCALRRAGVRYRRRRQTVG